jgi:hypothetical protein
VNPNHLFIGTDWDNSKDKIQKGRGLKGRPSSLGKGSSHPCAIFSDLQVEAVRKLADCGWSQQKIADLFGCSRFPVACVLRGERYGGV